MTKLRSFYLKQVLGNEFCLQLWIFWWVKRIKKKQTIIFSFNTKDINSSIYYCWFINSNCAAVMLFIPSWTELKLLFQEWSRSRNCCHCALPNVLCIVLETNTFLAAWSIRALTNFVFRTEILQHIYYTYRKIIFFKLVIIWGPDFCYK